ncbi:hypothetical protein C349_06975 [Cryptococcus neoformans var. grubii Br795]|nr:hypothetical protein C354_06872 [Cryptococcus neoformans var. grubii MW-RSA1955]OXG71751.1 hypothetical protein C349_06975 [Cryptococcus neoformans var. grubii Br795]
MSEHSPTSQNNSVDLDAPPPSYWSPLSNRATVLENNNPYSAYPDAELVGTRQGDSTELMTRGRMRGRSGVGPSTSSWVSDNKLDAYSLQNISMSSNGNANAPISSKDDDPDLPWDQTTGINFGSDPTVIEIGPSQSNRRQRRRTIGPLFRGRFREVIEEAGGRIPANPPGKVWKRPWAGAGFLIDVQ